MSDKEHEALALVGVVLGLAAGLTDGLSPGTYSHGDRPLFLCVRGLIIAV